MKKTKGIVLFAFGRKGYAKMAHNMAMSIKHYNPDIHITYFADQYCLNYSYDARVMDSVKKIPDELTKTKGKIDPAKLKTHIYDLLPYDENLYLDVDGLALKDLQPLIDKLSSSKKYYQTDVVGYGGKGEQINYAIWSDQDTIWNFFNLTKTSKYPAIQSSYCYVKKSDKAKNFFHKVEEFFLKGFPLDKIEMRWGGTIPDELIFSGTCAKMKVNPDSGVRPIFFGFRLKNETRTFEQIQENYYITSIYGNGRGNTMVAPRFVKWYNDQIKLIGRKMGLPYFTTPSFFKDKHANF